LKKKVFGAALVCLILVIAGPLGAQTVLFVDDFDDEASADPPGGWTRTVPGTSPTTLETSATSSVELSDTAATVRIMSTGLPTFDAQLLPLTMQAEIDSMTLSAGFSGPVMGLASDAAFTDYFGIFLSPSTAEVYVQAISGGGTQHNDVYTLPAGYVGGPLSITAQLDATGYQIDIDFGGFATGPVAWTTLPNGFTPSDLGSAAMAMLQVTYTGVAGTTHFGSIEFTNAATAVPATTPAALAILILALACCLYWRVARRRVTA
jgi:hypothetical protein